MVRVGNAFSLVPFYVSDVAVLNASTYLMHVHVAPILWLVSHLNHTTAQVVTGA